LAEYVGARIIEERPEDNVLAKDGKKVQRAFDQLYAAFDGNVDTLRALVELYCAQQKQHDAAGTKRERKQKGTLTWTPGYFQPKYGKHFFYKADTERGNYRVVPAIKPGTRAPSHYTERDPTSTALRELEGRAADDIEVAWTASGPTSAPSASLASPTHGQPSHARARWGQAMSTLCGANVRLPHTSGLP
jgi:hypothetical protein